MALTLAQARALGIPDEVLAQAYPSNPAAVLAPQVHESTGKKPAPERAGQSTQPQAPRGDGQVLAAIEWAISSVKSISLARTGSEDREQRILAAVLDRMGLGWYHVPNGGRRPQGAAGALKAQGVKPGVPDVAILTPAPLTGRCVVLELKREAERPKRPLPEGAKPWAPSCFSEEQRIWLERYEAIGWHALAAYGAADALGQLVGLGYPVGTKREG